MLFRSFCSRFSLPPSPVCLSPQFARSSFPPLAWCTSRMGIDTEFRRLLAARYDESFGEGALLQRDGLLVVDLLTNMFSAIGPQYNYSFTGDEVVNFIFQHAQPGFESSQLRACVVCMDLQERVPREKAEEQALRSSKHGHVSVGAGCFVGVLELYSIRFVARNPIQIPVGSSEKGLCCPGRRLVRSVSTSGVSCATAVCARCYGASS